MKKSKIEIIDNCRKSIAKLQAKQDKLFDNLKKDLEIEADDEYFLDILFDYCYNEGEYVRKLLREYL
jgi:hypothetical protein